MAKSEFKKVVDELYQAASSRGLDYGFLLLRVVGIEHFDGDPIVMLRQKLHDGTASEDDVRACKDFWVLIINLDRLSRKLPDFMHRRSIKKRALIHKNSP